MAVILDKIFEFQCLLYEINFRVVMQRTACHKLLNKVFQIRLTEALVINLHYQGISTVLCVIKQNSYCSYGTAENVVLTYLVKL